MMRAKRTLQATDVAERRAEAEVAKAVSGNSSRSHVVVFAMKLSKASMRSSKASKALRPPSRRGQIGNESYRRWRKEQTRVVESEGRGGFSRPFWGVS
jgi:hypothetical protein